jgi:hypothetical protein
MKIAFTVTQPEEAEVLSDIAIESKGHWGYSKEQLDLWRKDLFITKEHIEEQTVRTIWMNSKRVGFFAIKRGKENLLNHLWLLPHAIGKGIGNLAFEEIKKECTILGIKEIVIISDPDAEGFYLHQGAKRVGEIESIPQNRMLPKLIYRIH